MATPIKCLDLDDTSVQLKQEGSLYIVSICYAIFNEEALFYWVNLGGGWWSFFYLCPKLSWRLAGVSFYGPSSAWRAGHQY